MSAYKILKSASYRIDDIYAYSLNTFGEAQARAYITGLFEQFDKIAAHHIPWRKIPSDYQINGYFAHYRKHLIFWREFPDGSIGIFSILNQRLNVPEHLRLDDQ